MKYKFTKTIDENYGCGWLLKNAPSTYVPTSGMGVAHDILEHKREDKGTVAEELRAFGAILYVRGEGGYFLETRRRDPNPGYNIHSDLIHLVLSYNAANVDLGSFGPRRTPKHVTEWINKAINLSRRDLKEYVYLDKNKVRNFHSNCRYHIKEGYAQAKRRYRNISPIELTHLFIQIESAVDKIDKSNPQLGSVLTVDLNLAKHRVNVSCQEPWEIYGIEE